MSSRRLPRRRREIGAHTVEFALTAATFFVVLFAVVEIARALWMWNQLNEATRSGARVAAVCDVNDERIYTETLRYLPEVRRDQIVVEYQYLPHDFSPSWQVASGPTANRAAIRRAQQVLVRVRIRGYAPHFLFLFGRPTLNAPAFETTLPAESLGWNPQSNTWAGCSRG